MGITFEQFKIYWEFAFEVVGVGSGVVVAILKRGAIVEAFYKVSQGEANAVEQDIALDSLEQTGPTGRDFVHTVADRVGGQEGENVDNFVDELERQSPGQQV